MSTARSWVRSVLAVLALVVFMLAIRWPALDRNFYKDEIFSVLAARHPADGIGTYVAVVDTHPPLYYALLRIWVTLGDESEAWVRGLSIVLGAVQIGLLGAVAAAMAGSRARWLTIAIAIPCWSVVWPSVMARNYVLLSACAAAALWVAVKAIQSRDRWFWWLTLGLVLAVSAYSFYYALHVAVATAAFVLAHPQGRARISGLMASAGVAFVLVLPWLPMVMGQMERVRASTAIGHASMGTSYTGARHFILEYGSRVTPWGPLEKWGLVVTGALAIALWMRQRPQAPWAQPLWDNTAAERGRSWEWGRPIVAWAVAFVLLVLACGFAGAYALTHYACSLGGVASLAAGVVLARLRPILGIAFATVVVALATWTSRARTHELEIEDWRGVARHIAAHRRQDDQVWAAPAWERNSLEFYGAPLGVVPLGVANDLRPEGRADEAVYIHMTPGVRAWLARAAAEPCDIWFVVTGTTAKFALPTEAAREALEAAGRPMLESRAFGQVQLMRFGAPAMSAR